MAVLQPLRPGLHAADGGAELQNVLPGVVGVPLRPAGPVLQHGVQPLAVEEGGVAHALGGQFAGLVEEGIRGLLVEQDAHRGRGGLGIPHGPQAEVGQLVAGVLAVLVQAAHVQVGVAVIAAEDVGHLGGLEPHVGGYPDVEFLNELHGLFRGKDPLFDVRFIVRIHVLVKPPPGDGGAGPFHKEEEAHRPGGLTGVVEGGGRAPGHPLHHGGHVLQLLLAGGVLLLGGLSSAGGGHPLSPLPDGFQDLDDAGVKDLLVDGGRVVGVQGGQEGLGLLIVLHKAVLDHVGPGGDEVGAVGAEVVGHVGHPAKLAPVPLLLAHVVAPLDGHGLVLPVGQEVLLQFLVVLVGDLEGVVGPVPEVGQVVGQPVGVELNGEVGPPDPLGGPAHQLLVVIDVVGEGTVDLGGGLVPPHEAGHPLGGPVYLGVGPGPGDVHIGAVGVEHSVELLNAFRAADFGDGAGTELVA